MVNGLLISTMTHPMIDVRSTDETYLDARYKFLKDCGFDAVELDDEFEEDWSLLLKGEANNFWKKSLDEIYEIVALHKKAAERNGIVFSQMHAIFPLYFPKREELNEYLQTAAEKALAVAGFLNCPAVIVHPINHADKEQEIELNLAVYRRLMPVAKQHGVKICIENLFRSANGRLIEGACSTPEEACWYIDKLNEEAGAEVFGFCLDIGHANVVRRNLKNFIVKLGPRLTCLHIHDNDGENDTHAMPFTHTVGGGSKPSLDWDGVLDGLREINYRGNLSFEAYKPFRVFPAELEEDLLKLYTSIGRYFRNKILNG